jgi:drug/metabolite transporter (DMT)-like permease
LPLDANPWVSAAEFTYGRALFATLVLGALLAVGRRNEFKRIGWLDIGVVVAIGLANAANWWFYVAAINVSTVSVAVIALFTYPFLTAVVEPFFFKERHSYMELLAGAGVLAGVALVVPEFSLSNQTTLGVLFGLLAAVSFAARNILGRSVVKRYGSIQLMTWVFAIALLIFAPLGASQMPTWSGYEWIMLVILGAVLTGGGQTLFVNALKNVTSRWASLVVSTQPVITVALAAVILGEQVDLRTGVGGAIILASVVAVSLKKSK